MAYLFLVRWYPRARLLYLADFSHFWAYHAFTFSAEMRARHPQIWESLGRPTLVLNNSISNGLAVQRFLWRKQYEALGDPEFTQLARQLRTFTICYLAFFVAFLVWQFIEIFAPAFQTI